MRSIFRIPSRLPLLLTSPVLLALSLPPFPAGAQDTFLIPRDEGYGIAECLSSGSSCAKTVADAWCAAMGRGPSVSLGDAASVERISAGTQKAGLMVTCGN